MAGAPLFSFDELDDVEASEAASRGDEVSLDGEWDCLCDYFRTGQLVELFMRIDGGVGHYSVNGNAHQLCDVAVSPGRPGGRSSATFRWVNRNGTTGRGKWTLDGTGQRLEGSWSLDGCASGPWSWCGRRKSAPGHLKGAAGGGHMGGGFAAGAGMLCCDLDGAWDCACDYYRTGRPICFTLTIRGSEGSYSVEDGRHKLTEIRAAREDGAIKVNFRWNTLRQGWSSRGSGSWVLSKLGDSLDGGWLQDGVDAGPWSWRCTKRGASVQNLAARSLASQAGGGASPAAASPSGAGAKRERYALKLEGYLGDAADPPLDDLAALRTAYAGLRVGSERTVWGEDKLEELPDLENMRAGEFNMFVWQTYEDEDCQAAADALIAAGGRQYLDKTKEDGGEGVLAVTVNTAKGELLVSRDLLDSVSEMMFLERSGVLEREEAAVVVDIGAGYGRLARRMTEVFPNVSYYAIDGIPESTFFAHHYLLKHRSRAKVLPLTKAGLLAGVRPKVAVNIHSFSEQSEKDVTFWVNLMAKAAAPYFLVVPNAYTKEDVMFFNGKRAPMNPILESAGYRLDRVGSHFGMGRCQDKYFLWTLRPAS